MHATEEKIVFFKEEKLRGCQGQILMLPIRYALTSVEKCQLFTPTWGRHTHS